MMTSWKEYSAVIKLVDFGCAMILGDKGAKTGKASKSDIGTTAYWPPEAFKQQVRNDTKFHHLSCLTQGLTHFTLRIV